jgi:hypothetical protein
MALKVKDIRPVVSPFMGEVQCERRLDRAGNLALFGRDEEGSIVKIVINQDNVTENPDDSLILRRPYEEYRVTDTPSNSVEYSELNLKCREIGIR